MGVYQSTWRTQLRRGLALLAVVLGFGLGAVQAAGINVLVVDGVKVDPRLTAEMEKEGIHLVYGNLEQPLSEEMLQQFQVV